MWKFLTFCSFFVLGHGRYIDTPEPKIWVENEISETLIGNALLKIVFESLDTPNE